MAPYGNPTTICYEVMHQGALVPCSVTFMHVSDWLEINLSSHSFSFNQLMHLAKMLLRCNSDLTKQSTIWYRVAQHVNLLCGEHFHPERDIKTWLESEYWKRCKT